MGPSSHQPPAVARYGQVVSAPISDDQQFAHLQNQTSARAKPPTLAAYPPERMLTGAQLTEYLTGHSIVAVSSTRPDGRPHCAITSYVRRGITFWLPTMAGSVREKNVQNQPWVALTFSEDNPNAHLAIIIEGTAAVVDPAAVPADVIADFPRAWVSQWIRVDARRVLSYADEGAL